jgi:hypothetical protein
MVCHFGAHQCELPTGQYLYLVKGLTRAPICASCFTIPETSKTITNNQKSWFIDVYKKN